jgi:hypothetical protein
VCGVLPNTLEPEDGEAAENPTGLMEPSQV